MRVRIFVEKWVEMKKSIIERVGRCRRDGLCLACGEQIKSGRTIRGCHEKCARATYRAILRGDFTDEQRVQDGKWLDAQAGGRPASNPVTIEAKLGTVS